MSYDSYKAQLLRYLSENPGATNKELQELLCRANFYPKLMKRWEKDGIIRRERGQTMKVHTGETRHNVERWYINE